MSDELVSDCPHMNGEGLWADYEMEIWAPDVGDDASYLYTPKFCPDCGVRLADTREGTDSG